MCAFSSSTIPIISEYSTRNPIFQRLLTNRNKANSKSKKATRSGRNFGRTLCTSFNQPCKNYQSIKDDSIANKLGLSKLGTDKNCTLKPSRPSKKTKLDFYKLMIDVMKKEVEKSNKAKRERQKSKRKGQRIGLRKRYRVSLPFPLRNSKTPFSQKNKGTNYPVSLEY